MPRNVLLAAAAVLVVLAAVAGVLVHAHNQQAAQSRQDAELAAMANTLAPLLVQHRTDYPGQTFVDALHIYLFGLQGALTRHSRLLTQGNRFVQVQVYDPSTTPPQDLTLNAPGHLSYYVDVPTLTHIGQTGSPEHLTLTANGQTLRVYARPLALPSVFSQQGVVQVIESMAPPAG